MPPYQQRRMQRERQPLWPMAVVCAVLAALLVGLAQSTQPPSAGSAGGFPAELVSFVADPHNPLCTGAGAGHWDAKIRERGWILHEGDRWHLWYTGYDGTAEGIRRLGYATSPDGITWTRYAGNPLLDDLWVEDMTVVKHDGLYYMFAEGAGDLAHLLTSSDGVHWEPRGKLDVRYVDGSPLTPGPFGTPAVWIEGGTWYLFYERQDAGIWLATSRDLKTWTNLRDEPLLVPGPEEHDEYMIALNQVIKHRGTYYAIYHGTGGATATRVWNTNLARSPDLLHWQKYPGNPIVPNKSSGQILPDGRGWRLYTTHENVDLFHSAAE